MDQSEIWKRIKENIISENFLLYFKNILMRKIYSSKFLNRNPYLTLWINSSVRINFADLLAKVVHFFGWSHQETKIHTSWGVTEAAPQFRSRFANECLLGKFPFLLLSAAFSYVLTLVLGNLVLVVATALILLARRAN